MLVQWLTPHTHRLFSEVLSIKTVMEAAILIVMLTRSQQRDIITINFMF